MIYITGDTHGEFGRYKKFCKEVQPTTDDNRKTVFKNRVYNR